MEWALKIGRVRVLMKFMHWRRLGTRRVMRCGFTSGRDWPWTVVDLPLIEISWNTKS